MEQNLDRIVVQVRSWDQNILLGTGFIVDIDGIISTCVHVVRSGYPDSFEVGAKVGIKLLGDSEFFTATVLAVLDTDDVCLMQLNEPLPFGYSEAILGESTNVFRHTFITKGYSNLGRYIGPKAEGRILGTFDYIQGNPQPQYSLLELISENVDRGMSGAPVLDIDTDRVVGMISEIWIPPQSYRNQDVVFACPSEAIVATLSDRLKLTPYEPPQPSPSLSEDITLLLTVSGYRILGTVEDDLGLIIECELIEYNIMKRVIVYAIRGKARPADNKRFSQLLAVYGVSDGQIIEIEE